MCIYATHVVWFSGTIFYARKIYKPYNETIFTERNTTMKKENVVDVVAPIASGLAATAIILTAITIVEKVSNRKARRAAKHEDIITAIMREAQKEN